MAVDWLKESRDAAAWTRDVRRDIHAHPEMGNKETRTTKVICHVLEANGIEVLRPLETGAVGVLRCPDAAGADGAPVVAFRSDIDALPVTEATGLPYASEDPGVMHACGHDIHTASNLAAAVLLARHRAELRGTIVFIFQPDEEGDGGAERIIASGVLDELGVGAVYGAHVEPHLPVGCFGAKDGPFYACAGKFDVTVHGRGTHGAEPENGTDSLYAAARMAVAIKRLTCVEDGLRSVVTVGSFHAGNVRNIISDHADFSGIVRTMGTELRAKRCGQIQQIVDDVCAEEGVTADTSIVNGYIGVTNHVVDMNLVRETVTDLLGPGHIAEEPQGTMTTEDFGFYIQNRPGCFYHIGVGRAADGVAPGKPGHPAPLHSPGMTPDEDALIYAPAVECAVLARALAHPTAIAD